MKGAMAEPLAKTIKAPKNKSVRIMGSSQYFFLTLRKPHKSLAKFMTYSSLVEFKLQLAGQVCPCRRRLKPAATIKNILN
jgi:hypothetical protein